MLPTLDRVLLRTAWVRAALPFAVLLTLPSPAAAQTTSSGTVNSPAPSVSSGRPGPVTTGRALTLEQIVRIVVGNNSSLEIARQRLQRAQESINEVNAQTKPQIRLNANDTYSSFLAFPATLPAPTITAPTLPDNGQLPTVTDAANSFSTAFLGTSNLSLGGTGSTAPGIASGSSGVGGTPSGVGGPSSGVGGTSGVAVPSSPNAGTSSPGGTEASPAGGAGTAPAGTGNGAGTAPGATAAPSSGAALPAVPALIAAYVADVRTLLAPPTPTAPSVTVKIAAQAPVNNAARTPAETPARQGDATTGSGTTGATAPARGRRDTYAAGANVTQYLDVFGLGGAARRSEMDVRDFYALDIARLQNETALAAKNLFFNVLYTQALVATQQEQVAYAQEDVRITQSRLRNGIVSRFDVLTAQAALATAQQQLTAAQDQYELAQSELSYLIGTNPDQPQTLQEPPLPPLNQAVSLPQTTQIALRQRPEIAQADLNVDNAQRQVRLAQEGLLPTLGVVGSGEDTSNGSTVTPPRYATISLQAAVPLDDAGLTRARVRSAQSQVQTQAVTQQQIELAVGLEVRQATVNIRGAQAEVGAAQVGVARSQEALRLARERYGAGLGTFLDVLNALAQLATTRTNLADAQYFYQSSLAQLVRAMGGR